jgi:hypothetical protein
LQRIGANWSILSPNQAISSLNREQNYASDHADYVNADDANGLKFYTYAVR